MDIKTRSKWLRFGSAVTIGFGVLIGAAAIPALNAPTGMLLDLVFLPLDGAPANDGGAARLLSAICGGLLVGLGVLIWQIATLVYPEHPALGRRLIINSITAWFVVDSSMSIAAGAPLNALLNVAFLLVFVLPVWRPVAHGGAPRSAAA